MTMTASLLCDNPDGSKKRWDAYVDLPNDQVILRYGRVGQRMKKHVIQRAKFSQPDPHLELLSRSDKKQREGYYLNPDVESFSALDGAPMSEAKPAKHQSVLAALDDDEGEDWFF